MLCHKCGKNLPDGAKFCSGCGSQQQIPVAQPAQNAVPQYAGDSVKPHKKSKAGVVICIIAAVLAVLLLLGILAVFLLSTFFSQYDIAITFPWSEKKVEEVSQSKPQEETASKAKETLDKTGPFMADVTTLISSYGVSDDVAIAVVDNKTGDEYLFDTAHDSYVSWGFYLPVYMAFSDMYPSGYSDYKYNILSSDPAKCNAAANFAIDKMGGTSGITNYLRDNLDFTSTTYGRKFGVVNSASDNYTTAADAARILSRFNEDYNYSELCYNPKSFGVTPPTGASMNAQFGSENVKVKNNLNVFAVIKGNKSDYSVAILTRNKAANSGVINAVLEEIHSFMEGNS